MVGHNSTYFVKNTSNAKNTYTEDDIFVECGGVIFQQVIGIPMGTNCAPLLADLFLYSYEAEFSTLPLNALLIQNIKNCLLERSQLSHHLVLESNQY